MSKGLDASHLPDASRVTDEQSAVDALSQVLDCVNRANGELKPASAPGYDEQARDHLSGRLKDWLVKLHSTMKAIVLYIPHADSYSFTVGVEMSMTLNFRHKHPGPSGDDTDS